MILTASEIQTRVEKLGLRITRDYNDVDSLVVIGVLKGSFVFMADLVREIVLPIEVDFITASSYEGTVSTGTVDIIQDISIDIRNRHVLLVEDIVDTGRTLDHLIPNLKSRDPASLEVCTLLLRTNSAFKTMYTLKYVGFPVHDEFVIGYGMDFNGEGRNLNHIIDTGTITRTLDEG